MGFPTGRLTTNQPCCLISKILLKNCGGSKTHASLMCQSWSNMLFCAQNSILLQLWHISDAWVFDPPQFFSKIFDIRQQGWFVVNLPVGNPIFGTGNRQM